MKNVYIVLGEEKKDAQEKINQLRSACLVEKADVRFAFDSYDVARTISDIETPSLFGDSFFIVLECAEMLSDKDAALLAKSIQSNDFNGLIVFRSEQNRISPRIENVTPAANKFIFYLMFESQKPQFVRSVFRKLGYVIDADAVEELLGLVDNDKAAIEMSCKRVVDLMSLLRNGRNSISQADVSDFLDFDKEEDSIELFSHVANRRLRPALMSAEKAYRTQKGLSSVVLSLLGYVRRASSYIQNMKERGSDPWKVHLISGDITVRYPAEKDFLKDFAANYSFEASLRAEYLLLKSESITRSGLDPDMQMIQFGRDLSRIVRL